MESGTILRSHYQIVRKLGEGGFGDTYLARDIDLPGKPLCVVKHLQPKDPLENALRKQGLHSKKLLVMTRKLQAKKTLFSGVSSETRSFSNRTKII